MSLLVLLKKKIAVFCRMSMIHAVFFLWVFVCFLEQCLRVGTGRAKSFLACPPLWDVQNWTSPLNKHANKIIDTDK